MKLRVFLGVFAILAVLAVGPGPLAIWAAPISTLAAVEPAAQEQPQLAELQRAIEAFRQGEFTAAQEWLKKARQKQPGLAPAPVMLANMHFSEDQPVAGRSALEQSAVDFPDDPEPPLIFGDLAWRDRRLSDAQAQYLRGQQLLESFSGDETRKQQLRVRATMGLANVAEARGQFRTAGKLFSQVVAIVPQHGNAHFRLGNVLFALDRPQQALAEFKKAKELSDAAPNPNLALALLYHQSGQLDEAEKWFERAITEVPTDDEPRTAMARWQLEVRGDLPSAERHAQDAAKLDPESIDAPLVLGIVAMCRGSHARAEQFFAAVLKKSPGHFVASNQMAVALVEQGDAERRRQAQELAHVLAQTYPQNAEAAATLGWVAFQVGDLTEAEKQLGRAISAGSVSRDAAYYYARFLFKRGEIAKSKAFLQQALDGNGLFTHQQQARDWQKQFLGDQVASQ
jgi:tetratricopeptide (TPR) repeat protein